MAGKHCPDCGQFLGTGFHNCRKNWKKPEELKEPAVLEEPLPVFPPEVLEEIQQVRDGSLAEVQLEPIPEAQVAWNPNTPLVAEAEISVHSESWSLGKWWAGVRKKWIDRCK